MCKKLSVFCLLLTLVAVASADSPISASNPLRVDIDGGGTVSPTTGWSSWLFPFTVSAPQATTFVMGTEMPWDSPMAQYTGLTNLPGATVGSRNRETGLVFVSGTGQIGSGSGGFGMNVNKLELMQLTPNTEYTIHLWSFEAKGVWVHDGNNPQRKFGAWSTTNPYDWLVANGYGPGGPNASAPNGGYGPHAGYTGYPVPPGTADSNMPAALAAGLGTRIYMERPNDVVWQLGDNAGHGWMKATSDGTGNITLYGWMDGTDWANSMHMPLNGFVVVPEPATVALLGLGGLALLRRKRA